MDEAALSSLIDIGAEMLGFGIEPTWRSAIRMHLRISLEHAATVMETPAPDDLEPAPVFCA